MSFLNQSPMLVERLVQATDVIANSLQMVATGSTAESTSSGSSTAITKNIMKLGQVS